MLSRCQIDVIEVEGREPQHGAALNNKGPAAY